MDEEKISNIKQYWLFAPGENAKYWDEFYEEGLIGLGWDDMGDLSQYPSKDEVKQALIELNMGDNPYNATAANWEFANGIQIGDIIIVKKGRSTLLGYGQVTSNYYYSQDRTNYKSCRKVKWLKKGVWPIDHSLVLKTLTNITSYDSVAEEDKKYYEFLLDKMNSDEPHYKEEFKKWLSPRASVKSNKTSSYIRALEILSSYLEVNIFEVNDLEFLADLYEDVIKEQRLEKGKYYHEEAPSYGKEGYYSAAVKEYIVFHQTKVFKSDRMIDLLKYKKQIILQGPPGTGKTRKAKQIARNFITLTEERIKEKIQTGLQILTVKGEVTYTVKSNENNKIVLAREKGTINSITYSKILNSFKQERWNNEVDNNDDRMAVAIAKYLFDDLLDDNPQFKLIQFHPSFTYEDFVRGIVSKPNEDGDGVLYEAENKILADFAQRALENYVASQIKPAKKEKDTEEVFEAFITHIKEEIAHSDDHKYPITDAVYLFTADETRFRYKGDKWVAHQNGLNMKFSELKKIIHYGATERQDIKKMTDLEELSRQHATYFIKVVEKYREFEKSFPPTSKTDKPIELRNYVLIVDEINRANLSSVLGELIYALEYRGEAVESMYEVGGDNKLSLPPNLYIIGTMNTADRSVGHIDYAIRRRFAFVDVLSKDLSEDESLNFASDLFRDVKNLFTTDDYQTRSIYLSHEFEPKDVALGHSYFIDRSPEGGSIDIRLKYEIKPILFEYVKDGVLKENALEKIRSLQVS
ncbi:AAA family ATPase [Albibacterium indicum]|uniref:AAA family ATPase n=1 Tax=Albibacterium indicum TaxID=2292082 RepID=UPI00197EC2B7|nr:AAA family ATPase [Pedobacter indicus]